MTGWLTDSSQAPQRLPTPSPADVSTGKAGSKAVVAAAAAPPSQAGVGDRPKKPPKWPPGNDVSSGEGEGGAAEGGEEFWDWDSVGEVCASLHAQSSLSQL